MRFRGIGLLAVVAGVVLLAGGTAQACPMCAETVAADDNLPRAYMYSILFMLSMPALVFSGFSLAFYRAIKRHSAAQTAALSDVVGVERNPGEFRFGIPG